MNTRISSKLATLGLALMMNSLIIGGVSQLFSTHAVQRATAVALEPAPSHRMPSQAKARLGQRVDLFASMTGSEPRPPVTIMQTC